MIQVLDGEIVLYSLPPTGKLKNGQTVSGYHLLDDLTLAEEGWLPLEDIYPEFDPETEYVIPDGHTVLEDKVIANYKVLMRPESELSDVDILNNRISDLESIIDILLTGGVPE